MDEKFITDEDEPLNKKINMAKRCEVKKKSMKCDIQLGRCVDSTSILSKKTTLTAFRTFLMKYFCIGQNLPDSKNEVAFKEALSRCNGWDEKLLLIYWKEIGFLIPMCFFHCIWWILAIRYDIFRFYPSRWQMPVTMVFGASVAGATSEGGGAVAFPVMTLLLEIDPKVARDFSLMIQSCGMTSAAFTIIWMGICLEWRTIILASIGSAAGCVFGLYHVDHLLTAAQKKMLFVSMWFSFSIALFLLNTQKKRKTFDRIQAMCLWKVCLLICVGFFGGICTAFAGSGVDICSFSILTLLFRVNERVATPTSVVLMAINTCVGFFWRHLIMNDIDDLTWEYWQVSVPVVVICAPLGSLIASHFHRLTLASFVYLLEFLSVVGFLLTKPPISLVLVGCLIVCFAFIFFYALCCLGSRLHELNATKIQFVKKSIDSDDSRFSVP